MEFQWTWFDETLAIVNVVTIFIGNSVSIVLIQKRMSEIIRLSMLDELPEETFCHVVASEAIDTGMLIGLLKMVYLTLEMVLALFLAVQVCSRLVKGTNQRGICGRIWSSLQFLSVILLIFDLTVFAQLKTTRQTPTKVWKSLLLSWRVLIFVFFTTRFLQLHGRTSKNNFPLDTSILRNK